MTVKLFPNPANDKLWLQLAKKFTEPINVTVFDTTGNSRNRYEVPAGDDMTAIPVADLQPGAYFLQMEHEHDDWIKPFIVMR